MTDTCTHQFQPVSADPFPRVYGCLLPDNHAGKVHSDGVTAWCEPSHPTNAYEVFDPERDPTVKIRAALAQLDRYEASLGADDASVHVYQSRATLLLALATADRAHT